MTALKYKEAGTWKTLTLPSAVHIGTDAPDPLVKQVWVDTDEPAVPTPLAFLNVQKLWGTANTYITITSGQSFTTDGTIPMRLLYTPPVNAWWEVNAVVGNLRCDTAAYVYAQPSLACTPADADGQSALIQTRMQHSGVNYYEPYAFNALYKLNAGVAYTATFASGFSGGTWSFYCSPQSLQMTAKAWAR